VERREKERGKEGEEGCEGVGEKKAGESGQGPLGRRGGVFDDGA